MGTFETKKEWITNVIHSLVLQYIFKSLSLIESYFQQLPQYIHTGIYYNNLVCEFYINRIWATTPVFDLKQYDIIVSDIVNKT